MQNIYPKIAHKCTPNRAKNYTPLYANHTVLKNKDLQIIKYIFNSTNLNFTLNL